MLLRHVGCWATACVASWFTYEIECLVFARAPIASQNDKFSPAALINDVSGAPGPGSMKQIAAHPSLGEKFSPLAPLFAIQTLFEQFGGNCHQLVLSG
jgi:hypothetical protein